MDWPYVVIVMTTYFPDNDKGEERRLAAIQTFKSWEEHLKYSAASDAHLKVCISDDGSPVFPPFRWFNGYLVTSSLQHRKGVGASLNAGIKRAREIIGHSPIIMYMVDDWKLTQDFDISPWVRLLAEREDVCMVRLGPPHPNTRGKVEMFTEEWQGWGLRLDRYAYAFGHRPALYHPRMILNYGWFEENVSALECERLYAEKFVNLPGPDIVLALPHPWKHIDTFSMSGMEPV